MKQIFISGPYRAKTENEIRQNIENARNVAIKWLKKDGYFPYCPHCNTAFMGGLVEDNKFLDGDLDMLRRCDAIVMCKGWHNSFGACSEHDLATRLGLEIHYDE